MWHPNYSQIAHPLRLGWTGHGSIIFDTHVYYPFGGGCNITAAQSSEGMCINPTIDTPSLRSKD